MCEDFAPVAQMEHLFYTRFLKPWWEIQISLPVFCKLREVRKDEERENIGDRTKVFLAPTGKITTFYNSFKRGKFFSLQSTMKGILDTRVDQLDARSHQKSLSPQEGTLAQRVANKECERSRNVRGRQ